MRQSGGDVASYSGIRRLVSQIAERGWLAYKHACLYFESILICPFVPIFLVQGADVRPLRF